MFVGMFLIWGVVIAGLALLIKGLFKAFASGIQHSRHPESAE